MTDGIEPALAQAREMEITIRVELEQAGLSQTDGVVHLEYRVIR